ncbi:hypothetical protein Tco_0880687 [Tanacetum coccineum]
MISSSNSNLSSSNFKKFFNNNKLLRSKRPLLLVEPGSAAEGSNTQDYWGKDIMVDDVASPSGGVSRPRPSSRPAPSFRDVSCDAIHMDFFPFSIGPYYTIYPEDGVAGNSDSKLKGYEEKVANMTGLELQVAALKKQVSGLNDKLTSSDASFAKSKAKGKERKKKIKSLAKSLDNLHAEVARLSADLNQATGLVWKFLASDEFSRVQGELLSLAASAGFERGLSMHRTKDEFAAVLKKMANFMSEQNMEWVNAMVDGSDVEMTDSVVPSKSRGVFVQGVSRILDDVVEVAAVESKHVSSGSTDVVVALSVDGKMCGCQSSGFMSLATILKRECITLGLLLVGQALGCSSEPLLRKRGSTVSPSPTFMLKFSDVFNLLLPIWISCLWGSRRDSEREELKRVRGLDRVLGEEGVAREFGIGEATDVEKRKTEIDRRVYDGENIEKRRREKGDTSRVDRREKRESSGDRELETEKGARGLNGQESRRDSESVREESHE